MIQLTLIHALLAISIICVLALLMVILSRQARQYRLSQILLNQDLTPYIISGLAESQNIFKERVFEILLQNQQSGNNTLQQFYALIERSNLQLREQFDKLNHTTMQQLMHISATVEERLSKGFEKTNETFTNIIQRLAIIDDAQKKIADLSTNVISLKDILSDKRSRGAFGEVQLLTLLSNMLPPNTYEIQKTLSNGHRVDCLLLLPEPTGKISIDAKFPLENYKKYLDEENSDAQRQVAKTQFKIDMRKHIADISQKYIISGETSDGALMFIPAEAIFAEIHAHHPDVVDFAHQSRVFMASPSTMMALLTTAAAVLKDSATRQQIHVIQEHLRLLAKDFSRFETRMEKLSRHIQQANSDAEQVQISAQKITKRFFQIEQAEVVHESESLPEKQEHLEAITEITDGD